MARPPPLVNHERVYRTFGPVPDVVVLHIAGLPVLGGY